MKKLFTLFTILVFTSFGYSQNSKKLSKPTNVGKITNYRYIPSITEQIRTGTFIPVGTTKRAARPKMGITNKVVPGKGLPKGDDPLVQLQKNAINKSSKSALLVFDADITPQAAVTDPSGAVGPNHYLASWNFGFRIFDKSGNPLTPEASLATIFPGNAIGDAVMLYDADADRFIFTEFDGSPNGFNIAVSAGPDPVNDGWHVYATGFGTGSFPDYTKFSIWSDGYYVTANIGTANQVYVVERDVMIAGGASPQFVALPLPGLVVSNFNSFHSPQVFNVGNATMPAAGNATVVYMQDDAWAGVTQDHLKLWSINVDWTNTANSTISNAQQINTAAFTGVFDGGGFSNLTQPGGGIAVDAMQATIMNQAQFRKFTTHNSAVFNFVVDAAAGSAELAAVRWYELRQVNDAAPWTIFQEGTYTAPDGKHAWAASMAMDDLGSIGMAYTSMGGTNEQRIAINYTGRFDGDALNTMTVLEELIAQSSTNNPGLRYADYTHLTIDPSDDKTFWNISEYFNPNRRDVVGVFKIEHVDNDTGVTSIDDPVNGDVLTATEQITVTITNFGEVSQSNIPVSYTVNGGTAVNEPFAGPLAGGTTAQYTFTTTADMSADIVYIIEACTSLSTDSNNANDCSSVSINFLELCQPAATTGCNVDGIKHFVLNTIDVDDGGSGCNSEGGSGIQGYVDRRDLSTDLNLQVGTYTLQAQMNWVGGAPTAENLSVWIDFNDDGTFETSEQLISAATFSAANELVDFDLILPAGSALGSHVLRARCIDTTGNPGDPDDPCADYAFGETHDYTVNIIDTTVSVEDNLFSDTDFIVSTLSNNQFGIVVTTTEINERLTFSVTNMVGQKLVSNQIENENGGYKYDLDMSYATPGVYIIRLGNSKTGNTKKIVVK